jgi:hypothetical protein
MKTKILALTLMAGLAVFVMAQSAPPATLVPGGSGQAMPVHNGYQTNGVIPGAATNNLTTANTNGANGFYGNNGVPNGNGVNVVTNANKYNPYATYTNPNSTYINPNSTNVSPGSQYTNPYAIH